jgi:hypothetical protein
MTKPIPMGVRQFEKFVELNLCKLEELLTPSLPNNTFSHLLITKMHDSLAKALSRFAHFASIMNTSVVDSDAIRKDHPCLTFFLP